MFKPSDVLDSNQESGNEDEIIRKFKKIDRFASQPKKVVLRGPAPMRFDQTKEPA